MRPKVPHHPRYCHFRDDGKNARWMATRRRWYGMALQQCINRCETCFFWYRHSLSWYFTSRSDDFFVHHWSSLWNVSCFRHVSEQLWKILVFDPKQSRFRAIRCSFLRRFSVVDSHIEFQERAGTVVEFFPPATIFFWKASCRLPIIWGSSGLYTYAGLTGQSLWRQRCL